MVSVLAVIGAVLLLALVVGGRAAFRRFGDLPGTLEGIAGSLSKLAAGPEDTFSIRLRDIEDAVERLPKKWEDIKREAAAAETRARSHIRRAQKELEERGFSDAGVEQLGFELGLVDGGGGNPDGLHPLPNQVEEAAGKTPDNTTPDEGGWQEVARRRKFGA